jgi:tRNA dimethylallyltransferase
VTSASLIVLAGPTATGKTRAALSLARAIGGELVGADSVQVYRGFDIGSAKPTVEELSGIPHHLIDVLDPDSSIDAVRYAALADAAILGIVDRGHVPIVVGGTGLWLRALLRGLLDLPPVDTAIRGRLEKEMERFGKRALHERLRSIDPKGADAIHPNDVLRVVRALEVHEQTGEPLGELRARHALGAPRYSGLHLYVDRDRADLRARITERTRAMIDSGFALEVRALVSRHGPDVRAFGSVGYKEMLAHVRGDTTLDQTILAIEKATRIYARRQRTWFQSEPGFEGPVLPEAVLEAPLLDRLRARGAP